MARLITAACLALAACAAPRAPSGSPLPGATPDGAPWWRSAVFYEVFVRSYQDSDGDGIGDLRGLTARLDHLNDGDPSTSTDLGVDAVWLMPLFESPSYHGRDVSDFERIDRRYGSEADFDAFVRAAHARGVRVVLDLALN